RIIFQPLDRRDLLVLRAAEVNEAIRPLVAAAAVIRGGPAGIVAATLLRQAFGQRLDRGALPQLRPVGRDELASARGRRIVSFQTHSCSPPLDAGRDVDRLAFDQRHDSFLDVVADAEAITEALYLALADMGVDGLDLHREQCLDGFLDLRLGRVHRHVEDHLVVVGHIGRLFGDDRRADHVVIRIFAHAKRASSASRAALVKTSLRRRRMSATLMPCTGSTSMFGMLRAASAKFASTVAPSMISAFSHSSLPNWPRSVAVLASLLATVSRIAISPALALAESACFSARVRTFLGRSIAWLRGVGPKARPPPRNCGALRSPWRAPPEPFCFTNFLPVRTPSERCLTSCVPLMALSCW